MITHFRFRTDGEKSGNENLTIQEGGFCTDHAKTAKAFFGQNETKLGFRMEAHIYSWVKIKAVEPANPKNMVLPYQ